MRIAALYDIHGNLPALEAVLDDVRRLGVDRVVIGGDVVPGPMPRETLACLSALEIPAEYIRGNGDREVLAVMAGGEPSAMPEAFRELIRWSAAQLDGPARDWMSSWPLTRTIAREGQGDVCFCHASARNDSEIFTSQTPDEIVRPMFAAIDAPIVVCGHTHMQFDRRLDRHRILNAGSVGMPFAAPGAYWLLLGPEPELRQTAYDLDAAAARIRATRYAQAEEFAAINVLQPPSAEAMLAMFTKASLAQQG
jgi:putative phosphoesterase